MTPTPRDLAPARRRQYVLITDHAKNRMGEFGLSQDQVLDIIENPDITYDSGPRGPHDDPSQVYQTADWKVIVGYKATTRAVITVMKVGLDYDHERSCMHCEGHVYFERPHGWLHLNGGHRCASGTSVATPGP